MRKIFLLTLFLILMLSGCAKSGGGGNEPLVQCTDVVSRGHLNVLSINVLFKETDTRDQRLEAIAEFAEKTPVDIILLQEVAGGALVQTDNSAQDLQKKLRARNRDYDLYTAFEIGLPGVLGVANAILSRCEIDYRVTKRLPHATELNFRGHDIKLPRNVMMTRINVPNYKLLNIYNTHLCSACTMEEFSAQMEELLPFIGKVEASFPPGNFAVLGGDFNIDRFRVDPFPERPFYERIINAGFIDAYAQNKPLDSLCANPKQPDAHCTVEVSTLDAGGSARRVDYLFMNQPKTIRESRVVFNTVVDPNQPSVSDHAGVFVSIALP
ncbi:MAG: endonuclease/exonuclease/phosphatase family protein [Nitrosomonas sp.]